MTVSSHSRIFAGLCAFLLALTLAAFAVTRPANGVTPPIGVTQTFIDEDGPDDEPGQKDLNATSVEATATSLIVTINWDITSLTGNNSADGCFLFDSNGDNKVEYAICVTWKDTGVLQSVTKYTCNNSTVDRCSGADAGTAMPLSTCTVATNATDPFHAGQFDAQAECEIPYTEISAGGTAYSLANTCSYPSQQPNSDPSDCTLIPRDGFLTLQKVLVGAPAGYTGPFALTYTCTRTGSATISGSESVAGNSSVQIGMPNGYQCSVGETPPTPPAGYTWSPATPQLSSPVTVVSEQNVTLTVTNTLVGQGGTLVVKKVLVTDDGSQAVESDFSFSVNGTASVGFEADGQNDLSVPAGTYSVVEDAAAGFSTTYDNCTDVVIPNGGTQTCTITNDDQPATLVVKKVLVTDDGSQAVESDFSFSVNGTASVGFEADGQNDLSVPAGTYSVVEDAAAGFSTTYDNCTDVVIPNGGTQTCTITNDDVAPQLALVKVVNNGTTGTAQPSDFLLSAIAGTARDIVDRAGDITTTQTVFAGQTYVLSEDGPSGYEAGTWACANTDSQSQAQDWSQTGDEVVLDPGADVTCTIANGARDLGIEKATQGGPFSPGDTINYTVTVTNLGSVAIPLSDITVSDPLLGSGLILTGSPVDPLAPGASLVYTGSYDVTSEDCGVVTNTATVSIANDANPANDSATVRSDVTCATDLAIVKTADKSTYSPGETINYTLTVTNVGQTVVPVSEIAASDPALTNLTIQANAPQSLAPQQSVFFTGSRAATKALCGPVPNTASIAVEGDENSQNDSSSVTVTVQGGDCIEVLGPDPTRLRINKIGPRRALQGRYIRYRIAIKNVGAAPSLNTVIYDRIPQGMILRRVPRGATIRNGVVIWRVGTLQPGQVRRVGLLLRATPSRRLVRCNIGQARASNAPRVRDRACTRFIRVAGVQVSGVTG